MPCSSQMVSALLLLMECTIKMTEQRRIREAAIFFVKNTNRFLKSGKKVLSLQAEAAGLGFWLTGHVFQRDLFPF